MGGGGGSLAWAFFSGTLLPKADSIMSKRQVLDFRCIPMLSRMGEASCAWLSLTRDSGQLNTSNLFSESDTSNISPSSFSFSSSFSLLIGWEVEAFTLGTPSGMGMVVRMPSSIGPEMRKPDATTLIR